MSNWVAVLHGVDVILTRMTSTSKGCISNRRVSLHMWTAAQHALYIDENGVGLIALILPMLTIVPFDRMSDGASAFVRATRPNRFVSKTLRTSSRSVSRTGML